VSLIYALDSSYYFSSYKHIVPYTDISNLYSTDDPIISSANQEIKLEEL